MYGVYKLLKCEILKMIVFESFEDLKTFGMVHNCSNFSFMDSFEIWNILMCKSFVGVLNYWNCKWKSWNLKYFRKIVVLKYSIVLFWNIEKFDILIWSLKYIFEFEDKRQCALYFSQPNNLKVTLTCTNFFAFKRAKLLKL